MMEYQFDYATFCKTFNVKDDKAIDSLRLTHTQDINFKLFPYKARVVCERQYDCDYKIFQPLYLLYAHQPYF